MDAVRISTLGAVALASPAAGQVSVPPSQPGSGSGVQALPADPARDLFQQALQASAAVLQGGSQVAAALGLNDVPSLLAALTAPQAAPEAGATASPTTAAPAQTAAAASVAATEGATPAAVTDLTGSDLGFALQTALRFGAGVGALGAPLNPTPDLSTGLVRDATAVLRTAPLQPRAGGPGPEAFAPSPFAQQAARTYQAASVPPPAAPGLDLLA